jgi:hypothetical protein
MGILRATVAAILTITAAVTAAGQCVSEARVISTRGSARNLVAGPVAFGGGILVVTKFDRSARDLFLATYDQNFTQLTADTLVAPDSPDGALALVWNGEGFGLFYRTGDRLVLQRLTATGTPLGSPIPVSARTIDITEEVDVAWSDALHAYVVATTYAPRASKDVYVTILDRDGIVQRDVATNVFALPEAAWLNVAVTSDGTIGVFYASIDESILFARVTDAPGAPVDQVWSKGRDLQVAALGDRFYLVKQVVNPDGSAAIRWLVIDSAGHIVAPDRVLLESPGQTLRPLALMTDGKELALSYLESDPAYPEAGGSFGLRRFTPEGAPIATSLFAAADPVQAGAYSESDFTWTGTAYVTSAVRSVGSEVDSMLLRLCPLRARVSTPRQTIASDETVTFAGGAEGGAAPYSYSWNPGDSSFLYPGPTLQYRYTHKGTYTVTLTVTDSAGTVSTVTYEIRVVDRKRRAARK